MKPLLILAAVICFIVTIAYAGNSISDNSTRQDHLRRWLAEGTSNSTFWEESRELDKQQETINQEILIAVGSGVVGLTLLGVALGKKK